MNVALRAVYDALITTGNPEAGWHEFAEALRERAGPARVVEAQQLEAALRTAGLRGSSAEWMPNLRLLGVLDHEGHLDPRRADTVEEALCLVADSFDRFPPAKSWALVATLPAHLHGLLHPPPIRQTAGVLLELMDAAHTEIIVAAPFVDARAVDFLSGSIVMAGSRGVAVRVMTSSRQSMPFVDLVKKWPPHSPGNLRVTEILTDLSPLGSHAKVLVVDREVAYVGSANITGAGLGRHVEIGVMLSGPQIADLVQLLNALERLGPSVVPAGSRMC
jgi:PLD-like domain